LFGELAATGRLRTVALDAITPNPRQPRRRLDEARLQALADSIAERGVLQPPVVREVGEGHYELVAGERRWRAARLAGLAELEVLVGDADDGASLADAVMENTAREDLSPVEEARAYATMIEDLGITREQVGRRVGRSRESISNHLRLLDLPDVVLDLLDEGVLSFAHGRALLLCDEHATRRSLAQQAAAEGWSTRELEQRARAAGAPRARTPALARSAEQDVLTARLGDLVSRASGVDVEVRAGARDAYTFTVRGQDAARALARCLGATDVDDIPL
jgi:ParB family chromosome partitioning protein